MKKNEISGNLDSQIQINRIATQIIFEQLRNIFVNQTGEIVSDGENLISADEWIFGLPEAADNEEEHLLNRILFSKDFDYTEIISKIRKKYPKIDFLKLTNSMYPIREKIRQIFAGNFPEKNEKISENSHDEVTKFLNDF